MSDAGIAELTGYGPAMQALTEKQRRYVQAMLANPFGNPRRWALAAGYSDASEAAKVSGHRLSHDPKIEAAADELARQYLGTMGPVLGIAVAMRIARNPKHPKQLRAAEMLLNRVGLHETTEHRVTVKHTDQTGEGVMARIKQAAALLGVDPSVLLGENVAGAPMKVIEHQERENDDAG